MNQVKKSSFTALYTYAHRFSSYEQTLQTRVSLLFNFRRLKAADFWQKRHF